MSKITFFPGMPMLTFTVKSRLKHHLPLAEFFLEEDPWAEQKYKPDVKAYEVFVGEHKVGRFTIRRNDSLIERNFFCMLPVGTTLLSVAIEQGSFGVASTVYYDRVRILVEHIKVTVLSISQRITTVKRFLLSSSRSGSSPNLGQDFHQRLRRSKAVRQMTDPLEFLFYELIGKERPKFFGGYFGLAAGAKFAAALWLIDHARVFVVTP